MMKTTKKILIASALLMAALLLVTGCNAAKKIQNAFVLSDTEITLMVGESKTLTLSNPEDTDVGDYTVAWMVEDGKIASVTDSGTVTATAVGSTRVTAVIRAEKAEVYFDCNLTVVENTAPLVGMEFNAVLYTLGDGQTLDLYDEIQYSPAHAVDKNLTWTSSNPSIATVNNGVVVPVSEGITTVTATTASGTISASCSVRVSEISVAPTGISFEEEEYSVVVGKTLQLIAKVAPENATGYTILWDSDDETVAKVTGGKVTAVSAGQVTVTARLNVGNGKYTATCIVNVEAAESAVVPATKVTLNPTTITIPADQDGPFSFGLSIAPANCTEEVIWTCNNDDYLDLHATTGKFTVIKADPDNTVSVVVTCTVGDKTATGVVNIKPRQPKLMISSDGDGELFDKAPLNTLQLVAAFSDSDELAEVNWRSSDQEIATVDAQGIVTAHKAGTCTITAVSKKDKDSGASYQITVKEANFIALSVGQTISLDFNKAPFKGGSNWNAPPNFLTLDVTNKTLKALMAPQSGTVNITGYDVNGKVIEIPVYFIG